MPTDEKTKARVLAKAKETLAKACAVYKRKFPLPKITYDLHSKGVAGQAHQADNWIQLNPFYLELNDEEMIEVTVPHEIAHLICFVVFPKAKQAHGPEWKSAMVALGLRPDTHHHFGGKDDPHMYVCNCKKHPTSEEVHQKILKGYTYNCKGCGRNIVYLGPRTIPPVKKPK